MNTIKNWSSAAKVNFVLLVVFLPIVAYGITKVIQTVVNGASYGVW
jgi:hypothetical protein